MKGQQLQPNVKRQQLQRYCYTNVKGQQYPVSKQVRPLTETYGDSTEVLAASSSGITKGGSKPSLPCIFCHGDHFNDMCHQYPNLDERKKRLSQQGICFICLKSGHMRKDCTSPQIKSCCHCGQKDITIDVYVQ